ncbi:MAG: hypothetical protein AAF184_05970 [Pseudomonadota bacterium]
MSVFHMVVWVVAIGCITGMVTEYFKTKQMRGARDVEDRDLMEKLDRLERLEERVRVLEAIVTDKRYDLRREIDDLDRVS